MVFAAGEGNLATFYMKPKPIRRGPTVVSEKAYRFVPPRDSRFWPWLSRVWLRPYLRHYYGIESWEIAGAEKLTASLNAGDGVLITPNHSRPSDPSALVILQGAVRQNFFTMASAHLFLQSRYHLWLLPRNGALSVYREGMDRESLKTAIDILATARRPLVIFPEGMITRTNDRLIALQEGVAFIARSAAKQRAKANPTGKVVIHPLALRYTFRGDLEKSLTPVLDRIEMRLSWPPRKGVSIPERVVKIGHALLALKELEYFGEPQSGGIPDRLTGLLNRVLEPLERERWKGRGEGSVVARVKNLRKAILPDLIGSEVTEAERARRWNQLLDLEVAQQIFHFPPDYLGATPTPERLIETVERYEEALGVVNPTIHRPMHLHLEIGDAILVVPIRDKHAPSDALMDQLRASLTRMLGIPDTDNPA